MNLTLHIIRKDLRTLRWGLLLWVAACLTHLGLRLAQFARGDSALMTPFWIRLERSTRWDFVLVCALPVLLIPLLLQLDPLRGRFAFWKTLPISRRRWWTAKLFTLLTFFVLLPLLCEAVYFTSAQLASVLPQALLDWSIRLLPGLAAITLGGLFTRSLVASVPAVALVLWLTTALMHWPMGTVSQELVIPQRAAKTQPVVPEGIRAAIEPPTISFNRTNYQLPDVPGKPRRSEERLAVIMRIAVEALPPDVVVQALSLQLSSVEVGGRNLAADLPAATPFTPTMYSRETELPLQEQQTELGRNSDGELLTGKWTVSSGYLHLATKDLPAAGAPVEGTVRIRLARCIPVATLPLVEGAAWQSGLQRLSLSQVTPPDSELTRFTATLATVLADPRGLSGNSTFPRAPYFLRAEHLTLPYRKNLQFIAPDAWLHTSFYANQLPTWTTEPAREGWSGSVTDVTRSRKRSAYVAGFNPAELLRNEAPPIALARFMEEQAQTRNWRLTLVRYENAGTIELPLKTIIPRPALPREEGEAELPSLKPAPPALAPLLAEIKIPATPTREEATAAFAKIIALVKGQSDEALRRNEDALLQKIASVGADHIEVLLAGATAELRRKPFDRATSARLTGQWVIPEATWKPGSFFWPHVLTVASDLARPTDKALFLQYHSPTVDLLPILEAMGWRDEALPAMRATAQRELVPDAWQEALASRPGDETKEALLAQIRQRGMPPARVAAFIQRGVLPGREAASLLWETAVASTGDLGALLPAFALAAGHGVEIIPRDLQRILRLSVGDVSYSSANNIRTQQAAFTQAFSLRSECPPTVAGAAAWLEQNATQLTSSETSGRYELPGAITPVPNVSAWGKFIDPLHGAKLTLADGAVTLATAALYSVPLWATPRLEREFAGDFTYEVQIAPAFNLAPMGRSQSAGWEGPYQSAGILIQVDGNRFMRWEHGLFKNADGHELREDLVRGGENWVSQRRNDKWDPLKPTNFRISRRGSVIMTAWKQGDGAWNETGRRDLPSWTGNIRMSCFVMNNTVRPFSARFSELHAVEQADPPLMPVSYPAVPEGIAPTPSGTALGDWGALQNPVKTGVVKLEGNTLSLTVAPEGGDFYIARRTDAPRVLREVEGDFTLETTIAPTGKKDWNGAEILLLANSENFVCIGTAIGPGDKPKFLQARADGGRPATMVNFSATRDLTKPLRIRLQRQGRLLIVSHQQEGGEWTTFYPLNIRHWPAKIQAGVMALNTSKEPFTAIFSDFVLTKAAGPKP